MDERETHPALVVRQWLPAWDKVRFDSTLRQAKPEPQFYLLSMSAMKLRALAGIHRRSADGGSTRISDDRIQRAHDPNRSAEIRRFVDFGYPLSELRQIEPGDEEFEGLQKPGWLPTAVVVNILAPHHTRGGASISTGDTMEVDTPSGSGMATVKLPQTWEANAWKPESLHPIEVIDGQHRLWAFDQASEDGHDYELPVVAFYGLDVSWQAYLFWAINIKPKKINASLAFDLYPLLREQDWLLRGEGLMVYRETRSQELTEALWSYPESPWFQRINMLGNTGMRSTQPVTQAAFVRGLTSTFVRKWHTSRTLLGGLFGGSVDESDGVNWPRSQQAAFIIFAWQQLASAIQASKAPWAQSVRQHTDWVPEDGEVDPAFGSQYTLLASDQGVRACLTIFNDLSYGQSNRLRLRNWRSAAPEDDPTNERISSLLVELDSMPVGDFLKSLAISLAKFDWRSAKDPDLSDEERLRKMAYRGSGGYTELRHHLVEHLREDTVSDVADAADEVFRKLK